MQQEKPGSTVSLSESRSTWHRPSMARTRPGYGRLLAQRGGPLEAESSVILVECPAAEAKRQVLCSRYGTSFYLCYFNYLETADALLKVQTLKKTSHHCPETTADPFYYRQNHCYGSCHVSTQALTPTMLFNLVCGDTCPQNPRQ